MRWATAFVGALLAVLGAQAQQPQEPAPPVPLTPPAPVDEPVALPAEALTYAAELEERTQPKLLEWVRRRARELQREEFTPEALRAENIARIFPRESPAAQEAIRFLVGYEIYRRASSRQEGRAAVLRDIDRDIRDLEHRMRMLEGTGAAARNRAAGLASAQAQLEQLQMQRRLAASSEEAERKRVDACLRWLAEVHPLVKDTPSEILRSVPAPRS